MKSFIILVIISAITSINLNGQIYYTIGSTKEDVVKIQGSPSKTEIFADLDREVLIYGKSRVVISLLTNKLISYHNIDKNLRIKLIPGENSPVQDFLIQGSDLHEILRLNGTPTSYVDLNDSLKVFYGESIISFEKSTQKFNGSIISSRDNIKMPHR